MLLILTSDTDFTADYLIVELIRRQLPYFRLNAEDLSRASFRYSLNNLYGSREITLDGKQFNFEQVCSVWYRRVVHPVPSPNMSLEEAAFAVGELRHLALGMILNPQVLWVNPIDRVSVAEHKLYQLQVARRLGIPVPRTLVSNNEDELRAFCAENAVGTICKPIFHGLFADNEGLYAVYTRRVDHSSFFPGSIAGCPVLLQEEVPRIGDVRATFIGRHCFVADIKGDQSLVDWRVPGLSLAYSKTSLTRDLEAKCRLMLKELGLVYGAFDFIRTPEGRLVFLEINPTGEWAWLENDLGFPMRDAFIELFYEGNEL